MAAPRSIDRPALALLALTLASSGGWCYEDGAPPGHTGGFGEPDCHACHSDNEKNAPSGGLKVDGLPARYTPGGRYRITIVLEHPELASGGFQLALRTSGGAPAGKLTSLSERTRVLSSAGQSYLQHTRQGLQTATDGRISWELQWQAPETGEPVVLNVAANAANDDISALGDFIFTLEQTLRPEQ